MLTAAVNIFVLHVLYYVECYILLMKLFPFCRILQMCQRTFTLQQSYNKSSLATMSTPLFIFQFSLLTRNIRPTSTFSFSSLFVYSVRSHYNVYIPGDLSQNGWKYGSYAPGAPLSEKNRHIKPRRNVAVVKCKIHTPPAGAMEAA